MFITSREKAIIELIIKTSGKHTAISIADYLNVSVRTIHRDLKSIEKMVLQFNLELTRNTNEGLLLKGKNEHIYKLIQHLMTIDPVDQSPKERKLLLLLSLLQEESYKIKVLALNLGVSVATLTQLLDEMTEWLNGFNLQLTRKRGVGVEINGEEVNKRKALASYFLLNFHEELIESLFLLEKGKFSQDLVVHYFIPEYLLEINRLVNATFNSGSSRLADSDYIGFLVHICISLQRMEDDFPLEDHTRSIELEGTEGFKTIELICKELEIKFQVEFKLEDLSYLTMILKGSKWHEENAVPYDSVIVGKMIKNLIQQVSSQLHVDLTKDFSLFQGLLAHMEPSLFRITQQMGFVNPFTDEIKRKYPVLFMAVKNSVEDVFKDMEYFPDDEIAFIVLHFGSALVMREEDISIKALIVCPTGIGTSKMLASRIKKEIIEINSVEIKSIKDLHQHGNSDRYDVIISTVRLPFINIDYILVSPLLSEENIDSIRRFLRKNIEHITKNKQYLKKAQQEEPSIPTRNSLTDVLQELKIIQQSIESIIGNFRVYRFPQLKNYERMIEEMVIRAEKENLLTNAAHVIEVLKDRERKGGLGIPNTGMGLFHAKHETIKELLFQICHLHEPCLIKGMNGVDMHMKTLLLLLAPEELSKREQEIVSLISTSLIESKEAILIYTSSNEEVIRTKLESIFSDYLHTKIIRE